MNPFRTPERPLPPDDGFDQTLREVLAERVPATSPVSLRTSVQRATASEPSGRPSTPRLRSLGGAFVTLAATLVVAIVGVQLLAPPRPGGPGGGGWGPVDWDTGSVQLHADELVISANGIDFVGAASATVHSAPGDPTYRSLEAEWVEGAIPMRLYVYFAADDEAWWVTEIRTRDGRVPDDWIIYRDGSPFFKTPIGGTWAGDVSLTSDDPAPGSLRIAGLRLTAFAPGTGPAPLANCDPATLDAQDGGRDPLADGEPLAGTGIEKMTPFGADLLLRSMGLCHEYRYFYGNYSERWCVPPPGRIVSVAYLGDGTVILFVSDPNVKNAVPRPQPPAGWGCPADQRGNDPVPVDPNSSPPPGPSPVPGPQSTSANAETVAPVPVVRAPTPPPVSNVTKPEPTRRP